MELCKSVNCGGDDYMEEIINKYCPSCGIKISFYSDEKKTYCNNCNRNFYVNELVDENKFKANERLNKELNFIDINEVQNYIDYSINSCNSIDFALSQVCRIKTIDLIFDNLKKRLFNNYILWKIQLNYLYKLICLKINGFKSFEKIIADEFINQDKHYNQDYQLYKSAINHFLTKKSSFVDEINYCYAQYIKYDADESITELKEKTLSLLDEIRCVSSFFDLEKVVEVNSIKEQKYIEEMKTKEIDVVSLYNEGITKYNQKNFIEALTLLENINEYKNSQLIIDSINSHYCLDKENYIFEMGNRIFKCQFHQNKKTKKDNLFDLYGITEDYFNPKPFLKNVKNLISIYGDKLFYINENNEICSYNFQNFECFTIANIGPYEFYDNLKNIIEHRICILQKINNYDTKKNKNLNAYNLISFNPSLGNFDIEVSEIAKVIGCFNNKLFFSRYEKDDQGFNSFESYIIYDFKTKKEFKLFANKITVCEILDDFVIYYRLHDTMMNLDLYTYNFTNNQHKLIAKNIYDYGFYQNKKIYYYVGNYYCRYLHSINDDGSNDQQIEVNVGKPIAIINNFIYLTKQVYGDRADLNCLLLKISDNDKKIICQGIKKTVKIYYDSVLYLDFDKNLHFVDDYSNIILLNNVEEIISVNDNMIFYTSKEYIGHDEHHKNLFGLSLYKINIDTKIVSKIGYNISSAKAINDQEIIIKFRKVLDYNYNLSKKNGKVIDSLHKEYQVDVYKKYLISDDCLIDVVIDGYYPEVPKSRNYSKFNPPIIKKYFKYNLDETERKIVPNSIKVEEEIAKKEEEQKNKKNKKNNKKKKKKK